jgi:hypothetical protein
MQSRRWRIVSMNVLKLAETIGEILGVPKPTAQVYARFGRDDAILTNRGRGRNVAEATLGDAAFLTIVMIMAPRPASAARYMADFGSLRSVDLFAHIPQDMAFVGTGFPAGHTFVAGLATLFQALGDPEFVADMWPHLKKPPGEVIVPNMEIVIRETALKASLKCGGFQFGYEHGSIQHVDIAKLFQDGSDAERAEQRQRLHVVSKIADEAVALYNRPVKVSAAIESEQVLGIAAAVNGVSFQALLSDHSKAVEGESRHVIV